MGSFSFSSCEGHTLADGYGGEGDRAWPELLPCVKVQNGWR
jgi:hypothetical protein